MVVLPKLPQFREIEPQCGGLRGLYVPGGGITDYAALCSKYATIVAARGGTVKTSTEVVGIVEGGGKTVVETSSSVFEAGYVINCAGLHSDRVSRIAGQEPEVMIVPFRGEYYELVPEKRHLARGLIYPVPDPRFPFLGVRALIDQGAIFERNRKRVICY
jgi:L-2-hydroxyglutarate oxidase